MLNEIQDINKQIKIYSRILEKTEKKITRIIEYQKSLRKKIRKLENKQKSLESRDKHGN